MVCISLFCVQTGIIRFYMRCKIFELIIMVLFWYKADCVINGGLLKERGCNYIFCIYLLPQLSDLCLTSFWWKRASFLQKRGKCDFFVQKSLLCRYFALSLHSETDERSRLLGLYPRCGFALPSLCLRSGFALAPLLIAKAKWIQNGMRMPSILPICLSDEPKVWLSSIL